MRFRHLAATLLAWTVAAVLFGVGLHYLVAPALMPYHLEVLGVPYTGLAPGCQALLLTLMKGTGLVGVVGGVSLGVLLAVPFRRRESWSRWGLLLVGGTVLLPTLAGALRLRVQTGASSPWWPHLALLACLLLAVWLARDLGHTEPRKQ